MNKRVEALVEEARKLTPDEQDELLRLLVIAREADEPADGTPEEIEAAWAAEIERRIAAHERGETQTDRACRGHGEMRARLAQS